MSVTVRAPAKINLHLGVGPVRPDGFHPLTTVYQAIGLYDDVTVTPASEWEVTVIPAGDVDCSGVPVDASNLAVRAGRALLGHHGLDPDRRAASLVVHKGIPVAGGLAGGSADAAATLVALDRLWDLQTPDEELLGLAGGLGSDVPFALLGGTAHGSGRGEKVRPVPDSGTWWWVVLPDAEGLGTPEVYAAYDRLAPGRGLAEPHALLAALEQGDAALLAAELANDLEPAALALRPDLARGRTALQEAGVRTTLLSGSGPTWLSLCEDVDHARTVADRLHAQGRAVMLAPGPVSGVHLVEHA